MRMPVVERLPVGVAGIRLEHDSCASASSTGRRGESYSMDGPVLPVAPLDADALASATLHLLAGTHLRRRLAAEAPTGREGAPFVEQQPIDIDRFSGLRVKIAHGDESGRDGCGTGAHPRRRMLGAETSRGGVTDRTYGKPS